mmetsp:Transcript_50325/g.126301  ORF Transcript_50325/g.126301 Transcript_50325/m.126301 type:complete len:870 (-) Transcript_50325:77-2686(-)|eukprot:CAMPEP_0177633772 /NCGR_PEP_ID=MMETSP0447-20121125/3019_1 /TAXON_ID=0 /ORGANISM="Stygamoeba regulata, Strain BSH-02190019" /LENGTH=869 /DNA_ID=CAMNT_0019135461 /DNA_START=258 /DNA_END=2867 /DNA_ORIENTATION=-
MTSTTPISPPPTDEYFDSGDSSCCPRVRACSPLASTTHDTARCRCEELDIQLKFLQTDISALRTELDRANERLDRLELHRHRQSAIQQQRLETVRQNRQSVVFGTATSYKTNQMAVFVPSDFMEKVVRDGIQNFATERRVQSLAILHYSLPTHVPESFRVDFKENCLFVHGSIRRPFTANDNDDLVRNLRRFLVRKHVCILLGEMGDLKKELMDDVVTICQHFEVKEAHFCQLLIELQTVLSDPSLPPVASVVANDTLLEVIWNPTCAELDDYFVNLVCRLTADTLFLFYCGHGSPNGSLDMLDGQYHANRLQDIFISNTPSHMPNVEFVFNCCFAAIYLKEFGVSNVSLALAGFRSAAVQGTTNDDNELLIRELLDPSTKDLATKTTNFFSSFYSKVKQTFGDGRSMLSVHWGNTQVAFFPLSIGPLMPEGGLHFYFQRGRPSRLPQECQTYPDELRARLLNLLRPHAWEDMNEMQAMFSLPMDEGQQAGESAKKDKSRAGSSRNSIPAGTSEVSHARVTVFQAADGDSTLFTFGEINILIDGGGSSSSRKPPCFWNAVRTLSKLDGVFLTHGDSDHVNGLLFYFGFLKAAKNKIKPMPSYPVPSFLALPAPPINSSQPAAATSSTVATPTSSQLTRGWPHVKLLFDLAKEADVTVEDLKAGDQKKVLDLSVHIISPNQELYQKAQMEMIGASSADGKKFIRPKWRLSPINASGLVLLFEWKQAEKAMYALFTGDADGLRIIEGLKEFFTQHELELSSVLFQYVDLPHHGSADNHAEEFLKAIHTRNLVVSTNGAKGLPDPAVVTTISTYLKDHPDCAVHFNYDQHKFKFKGVFKHGTPTYVANTLSECISLGRVTMNKDDHFTIPLQ